MGNMSYCRFENTSNDLMECEDHMGDISEMSKYEFEEMIQLIRTCRRISDQYDEDDIDAFKEEFNKIQEEEAD